MDFSGDFLQKILQQNFAETPDYQYFVPLDKRKRLPLEEKEILEKNSFTKVQREIYESNGGCLIVKGRRNEAHYKSPLTIEEIIEHSWIIYFNGQCGNEVEFKIGINFLLNHCDNSVLVHVPQQLAVLLKEIAAMKGISKANSIKTPVVHLWNRLRNCGFLPTSTKLNELVDAIANNTPDEQTQLGIDLFTCYNMSIDPDLSNNMKKKINQVIYGVLNRILEQDYKMSSTFQYLLLPLWGCLMDCLDRMNLEEMNTLGYKRENFCSNVTFLGALCLTNRAVILPTASNNEYVEIIDLVIHCLERISLKQTTHQVFFFKDKLTRIIIDDLSTTTRSLWNHSASSVPDPFDIVNRASKLVKEFLDAHTIYKTTNNQGKESITSGNYKTTNNQGKESITSGNYKTTNNQGKESIASGNYKTTNNKDKESITSGNYKTTNNKDKESITSGNKIPEATTPNKIPEATTPNKIPEPTTLNKIPETTTPNKIPETTNKIPEATTPNKIPEATTPNIPEPKSQNITPRANFCGVPVGSDQIVFWGGCNTSTNDCDLTRILYLDKKKSEFWSPVITGKSPPARSDHAIASDSHHMYIIGGSPAQSHWLFNLENHQWSEMKKNKQSPPSQRILPAAVCLGSKLFVFGGRNVQNSQTFNELFVYNTETEWKRRTPKNNELWPSRRFSCCLGVAYDRFLVLFGGNCGKSTTNDLWIYDTIKDKWHEVEQNSLCPSPRGCHGFMKWEENQRQYLVLSGGVDIRGSFCQDVWALDLSLLIWKKFPIEIPAISMYANVIQSDSLTIFGGISKGVHIPSFEGSLYQYPITNHLASEPPLAPNWICFGCHSFTKNVCSRCKQIPFCSTKCQEKNTVEHLSECIRYGGLEDPNSVQNLSQQIKNMENELKKKKEIIEKMSMDLVEKTEETQKLLLMEQKRISDLNEEKRNILVHNEQLLLEKQKHQEQLKQELENVQDCLKKEKERSICPICFENDREFTLDCGHIFCKECIPDFHQICPVCRLPFVMVKKVFFT